MLRKAVKENLESHEKLKIGKGLQIRAYFQIFMTSEVFFHRLFINNLI